jgi:SAM-dependent methyltransferase
MNFGWLMNMFPFRRDEVDLELCYLRAQPGGSLLDVGCGSGDWLVQMKARGWQVRGVDFDSRAVHVARERGLIVESGALDEQLYPDGSFDAVVLNHVIEHVPDPRSTLVECERVLKKGGRLALITPNANSLAHRLLHKDWRGLEPPRHLHIFTPGSMTSLLKQAGFYEARIWTVNSRYIWNLSWQLRTRDRVGVPYTPIVELRTRLAAYAFTLIEQVAILAMPRTGECLAVAAIKAAN